jgi:hypothetical protein
MTSLWDSGPSGPCGQVCSGTTAPSSPTTNDLWFDANTNVWKRWDGSVWIPIPGTSLPSATGPKQVLVSQGTAGYPWAPEGGVIAGNF